MSAVRCPRCEESFRVPDSSLPPGIRLRCPWCTEILDFSEVSHRLPPMAELIDEQGKAINLQAIVADKVEDALAIHQHAKPAVVASVKERVFDSDRFDDSSVRDTPRFEVHEYDENAAAYGEYDHESDYDEESEYDEDSEYNHDYDPDYDSDYDPHGEYEDEYADEEVIEKIENRVRVEGPVAPRPLAAAVVHDFAKTAVTTKPRAKKSGSSIKTGLGVVLGGLMAVPLAGFVLTLAGQKPDWGFYPFNGTDAKATASAPMELSEPGERASSAKSSGLGGLPTDAFGSDASEQIPPIGSDRVAPSEIEYGIDLEMDSPNKDVPQSAVPSALNKGAPAEETEAKPVSPEPSIEIPTLASLDALMTESTGTAQDHGDPSVEQVPSESPTSSTNSREEMVSVPESQQQTSIQLPPLSEPNSSLSLTPPASRELRDAIAQADEALRIVVDFPKDGDAIQLRTKKADLYTAIGKVATCDQDLRQSETTKMIDTLKSSGLLAEMTSVGPSWLRYSQRGNNGLFVEGELLKEDGFWMLKCVGSRGDATLQLQGYEPKVAGNGDRVIVLANIIDANPPAIVRVAFMEKK